MANGIVVKLSGEFAGYAVEIKPNGEEGKYLVRGGSKPYIVTLRKDWRGARCSCPQGIFHARRTGKACKHERMSNLAVAKVAAVREVNPGIEIRF